jgi:hypothetical protein
MGMIKGFLSRAFGFLARRWEDDLSPGDYIEPAPQVETHEAPGRFRGFMPQEGARSFVTAAEALEIFDGLAAREDLGFHLVEGCYARAHLVCRDLFARKFIPQKAWAFEGDDSQPLGAQLQDGRTYQWWYHVAPALAVRMENGGLQQMVFDPALFDGPAALPEWARAMKAHMRNVHLVPCGKAPPGYGGDYDTVVSTRGLQTDARAMQDINDAQLRFGKFLYRKADRLVITQSALRAAMAKPAAGPAAGRGAKPCPA